ncbi:hypothetical protein BsWGS_22341 [Bradybaena similaris]
MSLNWQQYRACLHIVFFCACINSVFCQTPDSIQGGRQLIQDLYRNFSSATSTSLSNPVDLIFILDRSASVGNAGWLSILRFVQNFLEHFTVDADNTRVAVISYSTTVSVDIDDLKNGELSKCALVSKLQRQVSVKIPSGYSATHDALLRAKDVALESRTTAKKAVIVITDGKSNVGPPPVRASIQLRSLTWDGGWNTTANGPQLQVYTFGVKDAYMPEVRSIASPQPNHSFYIPTFRDFSELARSLHDDSQSENWQVLGNKLLCGSPCSENAFCACGTRSGQYLCVCKDGYQGDGTTCSACPRGTYKNSISPARCAVCPANSTTLLTGAANVKQCVCQAPLYQDAAGRPCYVRNCPDLPEIQHGHKFHVPGIVSDELPDTNMSCQNLPDSSCHYLCDVGYRSDGDPGLVCHANGTWLGNVPTCSIVDCGTLSYHRQEPDHADVQYWNQTTTFESVLHVRCHQGWRTFGDSWRMCTHYGVWSGTRTWCVENRCPALLLSPGLMVTPPSCGQAAQMPGATCQHVCERGYELAGPSHVVCTESGSWDVTTPAVCVDREPPSITCPDDIVTPITTANFAVVHWRSHPPLVNDNSEQFILTTIGVAESDESLRLTAGYHQIKYIARDKAGNEASCIQGITVVDVTVHLVSCSEADVNINMTSHQQAVVWPAVTFADHNNFTVAHRCVPANNTLLPAGIYTVVCVPDTHTYQRTHCQFTAILRQPTCDMPPPPLHGGVSCRPTPTSLLTCFAHCNSNYDFHRLPQGAYVCDLDGNWGLRHAGRFWPDCSRKYHPNKAILHGQAKYVYYDGECEDVKKEIAGTFKEFLENQAWELCGAETCGVEEVTVSCGRESKRRRRNTDSDQSSRVNELIHSRERQLGNILSSITYLHFRQRAESSFIAATDSYTSQGSYSTLKEDARNNSALRLQMRITRKRSVLGLTVVDDAEMIQKNNSVADEQALVGLNTLNNSGNVQSEDKNWGSGNEEDEKDVITRELYQIDKKKRGNSRNVDLNKSKQIEGQHELHPETVSTEKDAAQTGNRSNASDDVINEAKTTSSLHATVTGQQKKSEKLSPHDNGKELSENDESSDVEMFLKRSADRFPRRSENNGGSNDPQENGWISSADDADDAPTNDTLQDIDYEADSPIDVNIRFTIYTKTLSLEANDTQQIELLHSLLELQDHLGRAIQTHSLTLGATNVTSETEASNDTSRAGRSVVVVREHHLEQPVLEDCAFGYVTNVGYYMTETCVACPAGTHYDLTGDQCLTCPSGYYQPGEAQLQCLTCPDDTMTEFPGAHNISMCLAMCEPGQFSGTGLAPCHLCPLHTYQPIASAAACLPCPMGRKTLTPGAVNAADCLDLCDLGMFSETGLVPCRPCPVGGYQSEHGATQCLLCEDGLTTANAGSTNASECFPWDACFGQGILCNNGGHCVVQNNATTCVCTAGFSGHFCEINMPDCLPSSCQNNATCLDGINAFTCDCLPGFTGTKCEVNIDECLSAPCLHGGSCLDLFNSFQCFCSFDYTGARCESQVPTCDRNICVHGTCERRNGAAVCVCAPGFAGPTCNTSYDLCSSHPCVHAEKCESGPGWLSCHCLPGFTGPMCDATFDLCSSANCSEVSTCIPSPTNYLGYVCKCPGGYSGFFCNHEVSADFDLVFNTNSPNGQYVILPRELMPGLQNFSVCTWLRPDPLSAFATIVSFTLPLSTLTSQDSDNVVSNGTGDFETVFALKHTDKLLVDIFDHSVTTNLSLTFYTWSHLCVTWSSPSSSWQVMINGSLSANGTVIHTPSSLPANMYVVLGQNNPYYSEGSAIWNVYTGEMTQFNIFSHALSLDDIRALASGSTCNMSFGDVITWTDVILYISGNLEIREMSHCLDINECWFPLAFPCGHNRECVDLIGLYDCSDCRFGYTGSNCDVPDDECLDHACIHGDCVDGPESYDSQCVCQAGFSGEFCETMIDLCVSAPCQNGGSCVPGINSFSCACPQQNMGPLCERPASACFPNPCQNHGACLEKQNDIFQCLCSSNFSGRLCERRRNWCEDQVCHNGGICQNRSVSLQNNVISYTPENTFCECQDGWMGRQCEVRMVLSCELSPCVNGGTCLANPDSRQGYRCQCLDMPGVILGENCEFLNPCDFSPCANNTLCVSLPNNTFVCVCAGGRSCSPSHDQGQSNSSYSTELFSHSTEKTMADVFDGNWTSRWTWTSVGVTVVFVLLITVVISCFLWRRKHKRSQGEILAHSMDVGRGHLTNPAFHSEELQMEESLYAELGDGYSLPQDDANVDDPEPHQASLSSTNHQRIIVRNMSSSSSSSLSSFLSLSARKAVTSDDTNKPLLFEDYLVPVPAGVARASDAKLMQEGQEDRKRLLLLSGASNAGFDSSDYVISDTDIASGIVRNSEKGRASVENANGSSSVKYVNEHSAKTLHTQHNTRAEFENADMFSGDSDRRLNTDRQKQLAAGNGYVNNKAIFVRSKGKEQSDQMHNFSQEDKEIKHPSGYIPAGGLSVEGFDGDDQGNSGYLHGNQANSSSSVAYIDERAAPGAQLQPDFLEVAGTMPKQSQGSYIPFSDIWSTDRDNHSDVSSRIQTNTGQTATEAQSQPHQKSTMDAPKILQSSTVNAPKTLQSSTADALKTLTSGELSYSVFSPPAASANDPQTVWYHNPSPDPTTTAGFMSASHKPSPATTTTGSSSSTKAGSKIHSGVAVPSLTGKLSASLYSMREQHPSSVEFIPEYLESLPSEELAVSHSQLVKSGHGQRSSSLPSKTLQPTSTKPSQVEDFQTLKDSSKTSKTSPDLHKTSQSSFTTNIAPPTKTVSSKFPSLPFLSRQMKSVSSSQPTFHIQSPQQDRDFKILEDFSMKIPSEEKKQHKDKQRKMQSKIEDFIEQQPGRRTMKADHEISRQVSDQNLGAFSFEGQAADNRCFLQQPDTSSSSQQQSAKNPSVSPEQKLAIKQQSGKSTHLPSQQLLTVNTNLCVEQQSSAAQTVGQQSSAALTTKQQSCESSDVGLQSTKSAAASQEAAGHHGLEAATETAASVSKKGELTKVENSKQGRRLPPIPDL